MGSIFARPPARAELAELVGTKVALDAGAEASIAELDLEPPVVVCVGSERAGLVADVRSRPTSGQDPDALRGARIAQRRRRRRGGDPRARE